MEASIVPFIFLQNVNLRWTTDRDGKPSTILPLQSGTRSQDPKKGDVDGEDVEYIATAESLCDALEDLKASLRGFWRYRSGFPSTEKDTKTTA